MATPVIMPRQGQSVESCIIAQWNKKQGDAVKVGDILFSYETDKAAFDEEAKVEGTLLKIFFNEGDDVPVLTNVCVIGNPGESVSEFDPRDKAAEADNTEMEPANKEEAKAEEKVEITAQPSAAALQGDVRISPRARNHADKAGVDYRFATPTGPNGRIIERDIIALRESGIAATPAAMEELLKMNAGSTPTGTGLGGRITTKDLQTPSAAEASAPVAAQQAQASQPQYEEVKLTNIRKVIAKAMHASLSNMAQLTLNTSFDATEIMAYRARLKESREKLGLENITINDIIVFAVSRTILNHKTLNAHYLDDKMLVFNNANLGIAVDTERGLMVPTLFNANLKSLNEISGEGKKLIEGCQKGTINPDLLKGGSFTITNLGTLGIESFTPVINPPQTGILGVNTIVQRVREVKGQFVSYPAMGLSLTFDHRAIDGAPAARFLQELKSNLENFSALLAK